jgi:cyclopropane fatty-acyl-phospholipid synthase-like methyltransferase
MFMEVSMGTNSIYEDGTYLSKHPTWHEEDSPWKADNIDKLLKRNRVHPLTVCEVGCGAGGILENLATRYGNDVSFTGYEISPGAFELCRKKTKGNLRYHHKSLFGDSAEFDVVMAIDVFEHVEDYFGFLRDLRKKGAYKVFHIPLELSVQWVLRSTPLIKQRLAVGHIHHFTKETALATLKDTGYEVVDYFYTNTSEVPNLATWGWKARLLKVPRKILFLINQDLTVRILGGFSLMVLAK